MRGTFAGSCAPTATGQASAAPPSNGMNSRRLIGRLIAVHAETQAGYQFSRFIAPMDGAQQRACGVQDRTRSCVDAARVARGIRRSCLRSGASQVSGLLSPRMTAGPDVIRGSGPNHLHGLCGPKTQKGYPDRWLDRFASRHHHPRNSLARASSVGGMVMPIAMATGYSKSGKRATAHRLGCKQGYSHRLAGKRHQPR
jgi:hypothetical protein